MNKNAFIAALSIRLSGLPVEDLQRSLEYYSEYIADAMEDGMSEEEAVASLGSVEEIAAQILADIPLVKLAKHKLLPKRALHVWEIVLIALGSPLWISLLAAALVVVISVYVSIFSVAISLFAATLALGVSAVGGIPIALYLGITVNPATGLFIFGVSLLAAGLSLLFLYPSLYTTRGAIWLGKQVWLWIKRRFVKKEVL